MDEESSHGPALPFDVCQLVMDALFDNSSPEDHCYRNQPTYRNWSLVSQSWRMHAQGLLFRIVEVTDPASLRKFSAHLDFAPHLARHVRSLRVYSRHLFTPHNVLELLPDEISTKLPSLRTLAVTQISSVDTWHPLCSQASSPAELPYVPLSHDFPNRLGCISHITTLKLYFVSFACFCELARIIRAFHNLRVLAIIEVHWRFFDPPSWMLSTATEEERDGFLPNIEDLTLSWLDAQGPEHILSALGSSGARSLQHLYIDCLPSLRDAATEQPSTLPSPGPGLSLDLSHCTALHDLWISIPHPLDTHPDVADSFATVLASWAPARPSGVAAAGMSTPTLTLTPTFESDFTRAQFVDVLRALGPVAERELLDAPDVCACVCVIERTEERRAWWAEAVSRECFPRLWARGRVRAGFWKRYWDDCTWSEDRLEGATGAGAGATGESPPALPAPDVLLAVPGVLTANPDTAGDLIAAPGVLPEDAGADADAPAHEEDAGVPTSSSASGSVRTVRGSVSGSRRSLKNLPGLAFLKATKLVRALMGRAG